MTKEDKKVIEQIGIENTNRDKLIMHYNRIKVGLLLSFCGALGSMKMPLIDESDSRVTEVVNDGLDLVSTSLPFVLGFCSSEFINIIEKKVRLNFVKKRIDEIEKDKKVTCRVSHQASFQESSGKIKELLNIIKIECCKITGFIGLGLALILNDNDINTLTDSFLLCAVVGFTATEGYNLLSNIVNVELEKENKKYLKEQIQDNKEVVRKKKRNEH